MKIAMVTTQYMPVISGVSYYIKQLSEALVKKGHEIIVYTIGAGNLKPAERIRGVLVKRFPPSARLFRGYEYCPGMIEAIVKDNPDIINSHHYGYYPAYAGLKAAQALRIPHIFTPVLTPPVFTLGRKVLFGIYQRFQGKHLMNSDVILALSKYEVDHLVRLGADKRKIQVIYNPVNTALFRPKSRKGWKGKNLVLYVGPLGEAKGAHVVLEIAKGVFQKLGNTVFVFIGDGILEGSLFRESKNYPGSFIFKKRVSERELSLWYSCANVMLWPTKYEAFGRAAAEASASGTPVVATRVGALPEVILDGKTGLLVDYGSWKEMEEKLIFLLNKKNLAKKLGRNGFVHVRRSFTEDAFVKRHLDLFGEVLKRS